MKIGVIGVGAIGSVLCNFIDKELEDSELVAVCDVGVLTSKLYAILPTMLSVLLIYRSATILTMRYVQNTFLTSTQ